MDIRLLISSLSLFFLAKSQSSEWCDAPPTCDRNGQYIRHPCDCSKYYFCSNGNPALRSCGPGTYFDFSSKICNFEWAVECVLQDEPTTTVEATTTEAVTTAEDTTSEATTIEATTVEPTTTEADCTTIPNCDFNGQYTRHPCDCQKYYFCTNGEQTLNSCGPGTFFEPQGEFCNFEHLVECDCATKFTEKVVRSDNTIRLFNDETNCVFKKYNGYAEGDEMWYGACDASSNRQTRSLKFQWQYNAGTNQIKSIGASGIGLDLCWSVDLDNLAAHRVRLQTCDARADNQKFID